MKYLYEILYNKCNFTFCKKKFKSYFRDYKKEKIDK